MGKQGSDDDAVIRVGGTDRRWERGVTQESLRRHNLAVALRQILDSRLPTSRAGIAAATGMTRGLVSGLVDELIEARLVTELRPAAPQGVGRPAVPLTAARGTVVGIGMEVNLDYMGVRAIDLSGRIISDKFEYADYRRSVPAAALERLFALAEQTVSVLLRDDVQIAGVELAFPGLVDRVTGTVRVAPNLGWRNVEILAEVQQHERLAMLNMSVQNDAKLAAFAEAVARRDSGPSDFVYLSGEAGVGGAVVLNGEVSPGTHGWSGEIGHTVVGHVPGATDSISLEQMVGQDALLKRAAIDRRLGVEALVHAAAAGESRALESLALAGDVLGVAVSNVINVVDVPTVVLAGIFEHIAPFVRDAMLERMRSAVISAPWANLDVLEGIAGDHPAMTGGAKAALRRFTDNPSLWARSPRSVLG